MIYIVIINLIVSFLILLALLGIAGILGDIKKSIEKTEAIYLVIDDELEKFKEAIVKIFDKKEVIKNDESK